MTPRAEDALDDPARPETTFRLVGHEAAEHAFLQAYNRRRLAHAWLITGPRGIGKATLAFRVARFLLSQGEGQGEGEGGLGLFGEPEAAPDSLDVSGEGVVSAQVAAGSHPNLTVLRRAIDEKSGKLKTAITVDNVRGLQGLFALTAGAGGWRIAIIDPADDMNRNAANALLKLLEEPPSRSLLILVSHAPGRLLPTIRSRCRRLVLHPLAERQVADLLGHHRPDLDDADRTAIAGFADGSPGRALTLASQDGLDLYREMVGLLATLPRTDVRALHALGERFRRKGGDEAYRTFTDLLIDWLQRMVRSTALGQAPNEAVPGEAAVMAGLCARRSLDQWITVWENVRHLVIKAEAVNLDRKQVLISLFSTLEQTTA